MNTAVRIVKRGRIDDPQRVKGGEEKTSRQSTREIVSTVKGWVAELEQRQRANERALSAFMK